MIYEPKKTKIYAVAGVCVLVVAIVLISVFYKSSFNGSDRQDSSNVSVSKEDAREEKMRKDMEIASERLENFKPQKSEEQILEDMKIAEERLKELPGPSESEMQEASKKLKELENSQLN